MLGGVICFAGISFNDYYNYNVYMKKESKQERERERQRGVLYIYICEMGGVSTDGGLGRGWLEPQLKIVLWHSCDIINLSSHLLLQYLAFNYLSRYIYITVVRFIMIIQNVNLVLFMSVSCIFFPSFFPQL